MNDVAPEGQLFICAACGKRSKSRYGFDDKIDNGWDESCMLNSVLVYETKNSDGEYIAVVKDKS